jgi:hypothetical protein
MGEAQSFGVMRSLAQRKLKHYPFHWSCDSAITTS